GGRAPDRQRHQVPPGRGADRRVGPHLGEADRDRERATEERDERGQRAGVVGVLPAQSPQQRAQPAHPAHATHPSTAASGRCRSKDVRRPAAGSGHRRTRAGRRPHDAEVMPTDLLAPLVGLALVDSTSFGTLLIPLWLMLAPGRLRVHRVLLFLGTVATYYLVLGIALLAGATRLADALGDFLATPTAAWLQLALGVGLFVLSFRIGREEKPAEQQAPAEQHAVAHAGAAGGPVTPSAPAAEPRPGRVTRWRARAMTAEGAGSLAALVGLALGAAAIETASMIPYLTAIGLLTASDLDLAGGAVVLVGYCLVMILPALVLLAGRVLAYRWL